MKMKNTISFSVFRDQVLPLLEAQHAEPDELQKHIEAFVTKTPVIDDMGNELAIESLIVKSSVPTNTLESEQSFNAAEIENIVESTLTKFNQKLARPTIRVGAPRHSQSKSHGFQSLGDFALAVHKASAPSGRVDSRLYTKAPSTYANEGVGDSGGYLVPQEWSDHVWSIVQGRDSLLSHTNQIPTSRNSLSLPVNQSTAWGASGVQAYWADEGQQITQSKPMFEYRNLRLNKLATLVPASDELLEDATALDAFIGREAGLAISYKTDDAIINGNGIAKPLGILNSAATVTVAKETGQTANTVTAANIAKMYARMPSSSINHTLWLMNQDVLPQLLTMTLGNQPIYLPPNGIANAPFGMLFGRPIMLSQHATTLGTKGDIIFADFSQYLSLTKAGGINASSSMHLWFD